VPGDVRAPGSVAPHRLLAEWAAPCTGPADVLEVLHGGRTGPLDDAAAPSAAGGPDVAGPAGLPVTVHTVLAEAWPRPLRVDDLAARTGYALPSLLAAVTRGRVAGVLAEGVDGVRLRQAPCDRGGPRGRDPES
jgi:DNA processing protein